MGKYVFPTLFVVIFTAMSFLIQGYVVKQQLQKVATKEELKIIAKRLDGFDKSMSQIEKEVIKHQEKASSSKNSSDTLAEKLSSYGYPVTVAADTPALHVIGVYKADAGVIDVKVNDLSRPIILTLTAYDRTLWRVKLDPRVDLRRVILGGYHAQSITGIPSHIPIEVYTYDASPCDQCIQNHGHFNSYKKPPKELLKLTGLEVTSFQGRYSGSSFSIFTGIQNQSEPRAY